jgi:hypothetical protein
VARALNKFNYQGRSNYTMIDVWWMTVSKSHYVSWSHVIWTYLGSFIITMLFLAILAWGAL